MRRTRHKAFVETVRWNELERNLLKTRKKEVFSSILLDFCACSRWRVLFETYFENVFSPDMVFLFTYIKGTMKVLLGADLFSYIQKKLPTATSKKSSASVRGFSYLHSTHIIPIVYRILSAISMFTFFFFKYDAY